MYKIAICEDDQEQQKYLKNVIDKFKNPYLSEADIFSSGESLIETYKVEGEYSIILLDMQLDKMNGIETAETIRK